jgi:hypothetical protein
LPSVDTGFAQWLRDPALFVSEVNAGLHANILAAGVESEIASPLGTSVAAQAEAVRQMAVLGGPLAVDEHIVKGQRRDLIGKVVTLQHELLGYSAGASGFVIDADEKDEGYTVLQVVRKLT